MSKTKCMHEILLSSDVPCHFCELRRLKAENDRYRKALEWLASESNRHLFHGGIRKLAQKALEADNVQ